MSPAYGPILVVADLFMGLMWSRPGGLSLRDTWVTPSSAGLAAGLVVVCPIIAVMLLTGAMSIAAAVGLAFAAVMTVGSAAVALVWLGQRLAK